MASIARESFAGTGRPTFRRSSALSTGSSGWSAIAACRPVQYVHGVEHLEDPP
jgi:hypothetical protein